MASKMTSTKKTDVYIFCLIILYKYFVDMNYVVTEERFAYAGLFYMQQTMLSSLISWCLLVISFPFIRKAFHENSLSAKVVVILFLISIVPTISLIGFRADYSAWYIFLISIYWLVFLSLWNYLPKINLVSSHFRSSSFLYFIILICSLTVVYVSWRYTGFHLQFDLLNVYDTRETARGFSLSLPIAYMLLFADNILPFCVVYLIYKKKYTLAAFLALVVFLNFSITATKQILALLILGILGYVFFWSVSKTKYLLILFICVSALCLLEPFLTNTYFLNNLFPYRVLFIPAELHHSFFQFFSVNSYDFFTQGALSRFFDSDYDVPIAFLVGEFAIGDIGARANNGLFSDAFQNLGPIGVLVMPLFTVIYLKALDSAASKQNSRLFFVVLLYIAFVLLGIPITTALFSSGLLGLLVIFYALPKDFKH